ncbi:MAG TPA: hypothetical protein ACFCUC_03185 [Desulfobacterales bacterium]
MGVQRTCSAKRVAGFLQQPLCTCLVEQHAGDRFGLEMRKGNRLRIELDFPESAFRLDLDRPFRKNKNKIEGLYQNWTENSKYRRFQGDRSRERNDLGAQSTGSPFAPGLVALD